MQIYKELFSERLRAALKNAGLKQNQLAEKLGVEDSAISRWMNAKDFAEDHRLPDICAALNVSKDFFYAPAKVEVIDPLPLWANKLSLQIKTISKSSIPLLVQENWDQAGATIQSIVCYLLSGESEYKQNLAPEPKSLLENLVPYVGRTPWRFLKGE